MAEGWARYLKGDQIEAYSAGTEIHGLNPNAVLVMKEAGVDISGHRSKHLDEFQDVFFDVILTVCDHAREACPVLPGNGKVLHVGFSDPPKTAKALAAQGADDRAQMNCYRKVRDEIRAFIETLPGSLQ